MNRCLFAILLLPIAVAACTTVQRGPMETFEVRTTPSGAQASSTTGWECTTPCSVKVARRGDFVVTLRKDGYLTQTRAVKSVPAATKKKGPKDRLEVSTGWIGTVTDLASGANLEHQPNPLEVDLEPESPNPVFAPDD